MPPLDSPSSASHSRLERWAWIVLALQGALAVWAFSHAWTEPLVDRHEYRQAQTALSAYWIAEEGFSFAYPLPLFGPPWSAPMEFPLYQTFVAGWQGLFGSSIETSGRWISALMLLITLPAIWRLGTLLEWTRVTRILAVATTLSAPVYLFYGRTVLIETTAVSCAAWFLCCYVAALQHGGATRIGVAALLAGLAGLAKATTWLVFLLPAIALGLRYLKPKWESRRSDPLAFQRQLIRTIAPIATGFAITAAWVAWGDSVKRANPLAHFLTSSNLREWNYGSLQQRLTSELWASIWGHSAHFILAVPALAALAVLAPLVTPAARRQALGFAAAFLGGVLLFPNLFLLHDYYYCANGLFLTIAAALILGGVWQTAAIARTARVLVTLIFFGSQWSIYATSYFKLVNRPANPPPAMADVIRAAAAPEDVVLIYGADWGALLPFYAQRRAIMVRGGHETNLAALQEVIDRLPPRRVTAMLATGSIAKEHAFLQARMEQFGLARVPVAESDDGLLYVAEDRLIEVAATLAGRELAGLTLNLPTAGSSTAPSLPQQVLPEAPMISSPTPPALRGLFPAEIIEHDHRPVLFVHAPAELVFRDVQQTSSVEIEIGLLPDSYQAETEQSDGVEVRVSESLGNGLRRTLLRRLLQPGANPGDRGTQRLWLDHGRPFDGELVIEIGSGEADNNLRDWSYLARVVIR